MRKGQNPAKFVKSVAKPERITVAVLNYIPFLSGFYADMLDVLKVSLESLHANSDLPFDLLVFDNGSCEEVQEYLSQEKQAGNIQYLVLSEKNLGKGGAWNIILGGAPGEIIAYADNDVLYFPGWLSRSVELLESFPNVGMVTSRPFRTNPEYFASTLAWARENNSLEEGQFISWEIFWEFNRSLGQDEAENRKTYAETKDYRMSLRVSQGKNLSHADVQALEVPSTLTAFAGASHWQFVAYKATLAQFLPFDMDRPMGQVKQLDQRINQAGLLRLMVSDPLVMNLSNSTEYLRGGYQKAAEPRKRTALQRFANVAFIKNILLGFYNWIFDLYYK